MAGASSDGARRVWPTFTPSWAADVRALIAFLVDGFGFEEVVVYGDGATVDHAELAWPRRRHARLRSPKRE